MAKSFIYPYFLLFLLGLTKHPTVNSAPVFDFLQHLLGVNQEREPKKTATVYFTISAPIPLIGYFNRKRNQVFSTDDDYFKNSGREIKINTLSELGHVINKNLVLEGSREKALIFIITTEK